MYNERLNNMNKDDFKQVTMDGRSADKAFEGKPRSSFADASVRFTKNKANLVAFFIVALMILLSIFVPMLSKKDFTSAVVKNVQNLPPRIPLLEKIGIADGTSNIEEIPADHSKVDPDTGLLLPAGDTYDPEFIKKGTLENKTLYSTRKDPLTLYGQSVIYLDKNNKATVRSNVDLNIDKNSTIDINIQYIEDNSVLSVYLDKNTTGDLSSDAVLLGKITKQGVSTLLVNEEYQNIRLTFVYEDILSTDNGKVEIIDVSIKDSINETKYYFEGYDLSRFILVNSEGQGGRYERINGEYTVVSFKYYMYNKIFANVEVKLPGQSSASITGFAQYMEDYPELAKEFQPYAEEIQNSIPESGTATVEIDYTFEARGVPLRRVNKVTINYNKFLDQTTYIYDVELDGAYYNGFSSMPYFWFGTDRDGRDLFAQIWLSLRTSLFLGLIVSVINIVVGVIYGAVEGYYGGKVDFVMERLADYIASFPGLTILTIIYLNYGPGLALLLIYLTYSGWIGIASTTRIQFYRYRGREYVLASKSMGASDKRLIFKHILPNAIGIIITRSILSIPSMIFVESSLSFLGFGIGRGVTLNFGLFKMPGLSLGVILQEGQSAMLIPGRFYQLLIPSVVIIILMISFNMFGNALRDAFNPTLRGKQE